MTQSDRTYEQFPVLLPAADVVPLPRDDSRRRVITVRMTPALHERIHAAAHRAETSMEDFIRRAVAFYIDQREPVAKSQELRVQSQEPVARPSTLDHRPSAAGADRAAKCAPGSASL